MLKRTCPNGYTCLQGIGQNPNFGFTNFDNFGFSFAMMFQVFTLDYWNEVYQGVETFLFEINSISILTYPFLSKKVLNTAGQWNVVYFIIVVFVGAFYMVNLTFPVVALAYYTEVRIAAQVKHNI